MKELRLAGAAVILVALVVLSFRTSTVISSTSPPVPCTTSGLGQAFTGSMRLSSIQRFGCEGDWAFVWATVGTGEMAIGVTEVLSFNATTSDWSLVSRATDCKASILPHDIYRLGCFSN